MNEPQNFTLRSNWQKKVLQILAAIVIVALAVGGYFCFQFVTDMIGAANAKTEKSRVDIQQLQTKLNQVQNFIQDLRTDIQKVASNKTKSWKPIVIEHLVRLADLTLNTTRDTKLALTFLVTAQQYANGAGFSAVNHALNKDITNLQAVPIIETEDLTLKIEALSEKIESLPVVTQQFSSRQEKKSEEGTRTKILWKRFFESTVKALKDVVTIRRQNIVPMLLPEQETNLRLTIQAKLLQAELAVVHRQNKLYHDCLNQVATMVTRYFVANSCAAKDVLSSLQELQQFNLQPKLPVISGSIAAIQDYVVASHVEEQQMLSNQDMSVSTPQTKGAE